MSKGCLSAKNLRLPQHMFSTVQGLADKKIVLVNNIVSKNVINLIAFFRAFFVLGNPDVSHSVLNHIRTLND